MNSPRPANTDELTMVCEFFASSIRLWRNALLEDRTVAVGVDSGDILRMLATLLNKHHGEHDNDVDENDRC